MGCDIHMIAEKRERWGGRSDFWVRIFPSPASRDPWYADIMRDDELQGRYWGTFHAVAVLGWWNSRNYELFGALAGVRGGPAIVEPRGWPSDMSEQAREWAREDRRDSPDFRSGEHTPSWLTLAELQANEPRLLEACPDFVTRTMAGLAEHGAPEDVRILFNFDS